MAQELTVKREAIYLAGLLHDIGKFWQRGDGFWKDAKNLSTESRNLSSIASHTNNSGNPTHQHVYWTNEFLLRNKKIFQQVKLWEDTQDSLINLAVFHHRPQSDLQGIITLADNWASGMDREKLIEDEDHSKRDINWGKYQYTKMPLKNIFQRVLINGVSSPLKESEQHVFPISPLSLNRETIIGRTVSEDIPALTTLYNELWLKFDEEVKRINAESSGSLINTLHAVLRKYTWCIPADTSTMYDNSLYEHLKMTASLALCLYDYYTENPTSFQISSQHRWVLSEGVYPLRLWCVDLSGIQNFIYNISSKYAAKSLKGRSFYLQLLLDSVADYLIQETNMQPGNIIYSSGGKFFLLMPNTEHVNTTMARCERLIKDEIWEKFGLSLFICFGSVAWAYGGENFHIKIEGEKESKTLGDLWQQVTRQASSQKQEKYKEKLTDTAWAEKLFSGQLDEGGDTKICAITGEESTNLTKLTDTTDYVTPQVKQQIELGQQLKDFTYLLKGDTIKGHRILSFTKPIGIAESGVEKLVNSQIKYVPRSIEIEFLPESAHTTNAYGFQFYGGSDVAIYEKNPKTFEELAGTIRQNRQVDTSEIVHKEGNFNQLGILRMDVDGLGKLFTKGFKGTQASFSAYTTLSASLDWFFSGYLNTIRRRDDFKDWINIIYSGGDDIFAVGRWDKTIAFAEAVRFEFDAFTQRPELSISGGIVIVSPKYPIAKAAAMAGEAEDKAKDYKRTVGDTKVEKNALCLFDIPIGWDEFGEVKAWKNKLIDWLQEGYISKGLLMKLFTYFEVYSRNKTDSSKTPDLSWKWNAAYQLARQSKSTANSSAKAALNELKNLLFTEKPLRFEAFIVACRWAELTHRDTKNS